MRNRRKALCSVCKEYKSMKTKTKCQNCHHKWRRKYELNFFIRSTYSGLKQRCINVNKPKSTIKYYYGKSFCGIDSFYNFSINNKNLKLLFKLWQESNFEYRLVPSIDRIDSSKGYIEGNLQWITHSQNSLKSNIKHITYVYDKDMNFIKEYSSQSEASRQLNIPQGNIWKVLQGERKTAGGYIFRKERA